MASNEDGEDLIDLGNDACVPRVTVHDSTPEEQEHLLDVCPPKLEQKLSLTKRQERVLDSADNKGDILVTLGHDQVVPIRKRIDVVSSDTIKRVRDITRNLEPVIRRTRSGVSGGDAGTRQRDRAADVTDHVVVVSGCDGAATTARHNRDETYETREINNAFNFLAEHDDSECQAETSFDRPARRELDPDRSVSISMRPLTEKEDTGDYPSFGVASDGVTGERKDVVPNEQRNAQLDNPAYESSPSAKSSSDRVSVPVVEQPRARATFASKRRGEEDTDVVSKRESKRRDSYRDSHRKSWTGGTCPAVTDDRPRGIDGPEEERRRRVPPSTAADVDRDVCNFLTRSPPEAELTTTTTTTTAISAEDDCSEGSEVDWSWLEEVECLRNGGDSLAVECAGEQAGGSDSPTSGNTGRRRAGDGRETAATRSVAMSVTATAKSLAVGGTRRTPAGGGAFHLDRQNNNNRHRRRSRGNNDRNNNNEAAGDADENEAAARCNATNEAVDRENRHHRDSTTTTTTTTSGSIVGSSVAAAANSWMRASMRRLRHLRLPEGGSSAESANRRAAIVSAPNSLPDIALIAPEILAAQTNGTSGTLLRPSSAPARNNTTTASAVAAAAGGVVVGYAATPRRAGRQFAGGRSRGARNHEAATSRQGSLGSATTASDTTASGTTTCSSSFAATSTSPASSTATSPQRATSRRTCERQRDVDRHNDRGEDDDEDENPLGRWPHALSPALACLGCTLGLFNISRFAILSVQFGANFIVQFLILSLILGIPLLTLHVCLGQRLAAGSVDMWRISPLFQGVGIALLTAQAFIGIYSIVGVSWMFVYFRDSFITKQDRYRWAEPFLLYREDSRPTHNTTASYKLHETVPDYFSGAVLQRHHLNEADPGVVTLKFQVAFNLAVVWMIVFVSLSKGLRSYGKVVYVFTLVPVVGTLVLCAKLLGLNATGSIQHQLFPATVWSEFFINGKSWVAASNEVFLTWGLLGAAAMQIAAHNKHKHLLQRDTSLVVVLTFAVLLLAAFLANTCVQILRHHGYIYTTSSFERISGYTFMRLANQPAPPGYSSTPERFMSHASFLLGQRVTRPGVDTSTESGYQVLRLSTELVPATLALLGTEQVSPFWAVLFYFILILFGIAQQLAIWHCVITGIMAINTKMMKLWETTITFFSCACAYILGLPMATELGIYVVYYLDYTVGGAWWIIILYLIQIGAVFAVRGRPHTGEAVVAELFPPTGRCLRYWAGPLLSFTWNVVLPVTLLVLTITIFKSSGFRELYSYRRTSRDYWAVWARQLGAAIQLIPILMIPAVAIIQICRYLNRGPPDIFDNEQVEVTVNHCEQCNGRIQLLYRPQLEPDDPRDQHTQIGNDAGNGLHGNGILPTATTEIPFEDPPPKYTPPPSYTTATGARIAKMLRQSFRRSVRRIANALGESSSTLRQRPALQQQPPPPDYATVLVEMNQQQSSSAPMSRDIAIHVTESRTDVTNTDHDGNYRRDQGDTAIERHRPNTIDRTTNRVAMVERRMLERTHSTFDRRYRGRARCANAVTLSGSNLTAADVANLLRSSIRRGTVRTQQSLRRSFCHEESTTAATSVENLVEAAAPIGEDSLILMKDASLVSGEQLDGRHDVDAGNVNNDGDDDDRSDGSIGGGGGENNEKKAADEMESPVSVI